MLTRALKKNIAVRDVQSNTADQPSWSRVPNNGPKPFNLRIEALTMPELSSRLSAIDLGLSDPNHEVRLKAAFNFGRYLEKLFVEVGMQAVLDALFERINRPKLTFKQADPRLAEGLRFCSERSKTSIRFGVFMTIQSIFRNQHCALSVPLAKVFDDLGVIDIIQEGRKDQEFAARLVASGFALPNISADGATPHAGLFTMFKFAVTRGCFSNPELTNKFFNGLTPQTPVMQVAHSTTIGMLRTLSCLMSTIADSVQNPLRTNAINSELDLVIRCVCSPRPPK